MPKLSKLTDYYDEQPAVEALPVANPYRRVPVYKSEDITPENKVEGQPSTLSSNIDKVLNALFRDDEKRLQLWPEKVIREAITAAPSVMSGETPQWAIDPETGDVHTNPQMVEKAQAMSALAGTGGLAGTTEATLGATPFLRPALKYKDRLYKGKEGQQHMDVIPEALYPEFQKMAMSGEDISHYNFGFVNDKGHFLDREKALKYAIDTGMVDKFAGQYGALTSTLLADSSKPGMAIEAMGKSNAPAFFSAVEHNVAKIPQSKMTGDQWLGTLSNKPGVKPEELDWTGLKSFLEENKGKPVTKQQIEEHLAANKVELKEVNKGTGELQAAAKDLQAAIGEKPITLPGWRNSLYADEIEQGLWSNDLTPKDLPANLQPYAEKMLSLRHQQENPTKYHSYQLPGGENYREMLLTLPKEPKIKWVKNQDGSVTGDGYTIKNEPQNGQDFFVTYGNNGRRLSGNDSLENAQNLIEMAGRNAAKSDYYRSSHWDEPNILAHVRMNDRYFDNPNIAKPKAITDADFARMKELDKLLAKADYSNPETIKLMKEQNELGARLENSKNKTFAPNEGKLKSLHLEEIQSDWHQQGRDRGYKTGAKEIPYISPDDLKLVEGQHDWMVKTPSGKEVRVGKGVTPTEIEAKDYLVRHINKGIAEANSAARIAEAEKLPDAPFKKSWHELALKRMIREASEKGYDRLSWTPGEAQAARYDLSKQVSTVVYKDGKLTAIGPSGQHVINNQAVSKEKLSDYLGKEAAEKLLKQEPHNGAQALQGEQLKVGGEGMKGFYDQIIPKALEKLGKEHGVKVKSGKIPSEENFHQETRTNRPTQIVHYIDIPQSLKDTALHKGFPLFSSTHHGFIFTPVDFDPFEKK